MTTIAVAPLVLKDVLLTIGTDNYEKHVSGVVFTPKASTISWQGLTPAAKFTDVTAAEWTCVLSYVQDWETTNSLSAYLFANEGDTIAVEFKPKSGSGPTFEANLVITPGAIGGQVNAYATTSVTLGSDRPVLVPAA
ncbi:MAG: hypothetical protein JWP85_991 [Rhodoglobus sp.]|nr:hypothetical protein [Rhodoglobus sp.]